MLRRTGSTSATRLTRDFTLAGHGATLRALAQARGQLGTLVALGVLRHVLRLAPTLAIGLAIDRVASTRAWATLATIVSGLCLLALLETLFTTAHQRLRQALITRIARLIGAPSRRASAAQVAIVDLAAGLGAAPLAMLGMIAAMALASGRLAALVAMLLAAQAAIIAIATPAHGRIAQALQAAERALGAAQTDFGGGRALGVLEPGARRRTRRREAGRARIAALLEQCRAASSNAVALVERLGFAAVLGLASLDVMAAQLTPGALIATTLVLRQLQGLADGLGKAWLRVVETAQGEARAAAPPRRPSQLPNLEVAAGDMVVIVGATGSGKSALLRGFVERQRRDTAGAIAWVEQQPMLCDLSIAEALRLAAPRADAARFTQAMRVSQLATLLRELPLGRAQPCGPHGEALPGGVRHLVALTGALARDPRILVVDALPEALDGPLRAALLASLLSWRDGTRSLVVATASPSWIAAADRIVVLERGRVRADIRPRPRRVAA